MKIFDTFLFFNELDLLELRLNTLYEHVDCFVLSESTKTFAGKPKPLYYNENKARFAKFSHKIIHNIVDDTPDDFTNWTPPNPYFTDREKSYPHKSGGQPLKRLNLTFQREVFQRDSVILALLGTAEDDDVILSSDLDEIPDPHIIRQKIPSIRSDRLYHFRQRWYMYYLNVYCDREWFGTRACRFSYLKQGSVDLLRYHTEDRAAQTGEIIEDAGWHFSFLGGAEKVKEKLDAYSYQGRRTQLFLRLFDRIFSSRIQKKLENNEDIFFDGRKFETVPVDDSFPPYLLSHPGRFAAYIKS